MITSKVETIDRGAAERYLDLDRGNNRPFSPNHLAELVGRQQRGEWVTNGDAIRFDVDGQLRDGVHRLRMVKATGMSIDVVVVREIDPSAFITMDVGKKRSLGDVLYIEKEPNHSNLAWTLILVWRYLSRKMTGPSASFEEYHVALERHPKIRDSVAFCLNIEQRASPPGHMSVTMAFHYLCSCVDASKANDFVKQYVTGLGPAFAEDELDNPIYVVREQIVSYARGPWNPSRQQILIFLARAWNAHQAGQTVKKRFKVPTKEQVKVSPTIDGFPNELFLKRQPSLPEDEEEEEA